MQLPPPPINPPKSALTDAFTLIEMSIVLVIIGLIVGGVLVGQDLIAAAAIRSQVAQIEKYNTAVNTFRVKTGYLPGDIPDPIASQFGFAARGTYAGTGDGDGIINGYVGCGGGCNYGWAQGGEVVLFWQDLSKAGLIDSGFNSASWGALGTVTGTSLNLYYPQAKAGGGNYVYVYTTSYTTVKVAQINYFGVSVISQVGGANGCSPCISSTPGLTVQQAYNIDKKVDDGSPQTGKITATYLNNLVVGGVNQPALAAGGGVSGAAVGGSAPGSSLTCYDNGSGSGAMQYSVGQNGGNGLNCALSFQFQ